MSKLKTFISALLCIILVGTHATITIAGDEDPEFEGDGALTDDATDDNFNIGGALMDFSTYGATDTIETGSTKYIGLSFSDVTDKNLSDKLGLLSALGIMVGSDGKAEPDKNMTRGEMAKAIINFVNLSDTSITASKDKAFYDVDEDNIFYNEIYTACNLNYISGFNDNTFRPDDDISAEDAITIIMRALGYSVPADKNGGYPSGYLYYALKAGLTKNTSLVYEQAITRRDAATLFYNALMAYIFGTTESEEEVSWEKGDTALYKFFGIKYDTGDIQATDISAIDGYGDVGENCLRINNAKYSCFIEGICGYLGYNVKYYYISDGGERDGEIIYFETTKDNTEIIINADDFISYSDYTLKYYKGSRTKVAKVAPTHGLILNGVQCYDYDESVFYIKTGNIRLLSSAGGDTYDKIFISTFYNMYVSSISMDGSVLTIQSDYNTHALKFDMDQTICELYDALGQIEMSSSVTDSYDADGNKIKKYTLPPIPTKTLISVFSSDIQYSGSDYYSKETPDYIKIYISRVSLEGSVSAIMHENDGEISEIGFAGYSLDVSKGNLFDTATYTLKTGDSGTLWVDYDNNAALLVCDDAYGGYRYGYLINATVDKDSGDDGLIIKLMDSKGDIAKYYNDEITINGKHYKGMYDAQNQLHISAGMLDSTFTISQPIKYKSNGDRIIEIQTVTASVGIADGYSTEQLRREGERTSVYTNHYFGYDMWIKGTRLVDGTLKSVSEMVYGKPGIEFVVPNEETFEEDDYGLITKWDDDDYKTADVFDCDEYRDPALLVAYEQKQVQMFTSPYVVVSKVGKMINEDDEIVPFITCHNGVKEMTYEGYSIDTFSNIKKGDVVCLYGTKEIVKNWSKINNIYDIIDYDYSNEVASSHNLGSLYWTAFEIYAIDNNRTMTVQIGEPVGENKRKNQRVAYWPSGSNVLKYGACLCTVNEGDQLTLTTAKLSDIKGAKSYGIGESSILYIAESNGYSPKCIIIINKER